MRDIVAEHPWCLTLRAFIEKVKAAYGITYGEDEARRLPDKKLVKMPYLKDQTGRKCQLPATLGMDDQLDEFVTASLCRRLRLPPEDFGLKPEKD